jgi:hypothetical protein
LIVLDIIGNVSPRDFWNTIDLDNIEPFTIVLFQEQDLFSFGGMELKKQYTLDTDKRHIWSSSTLPPEIREERSILFEAFLGTIRSCQKSKCMIFIVILKKEIKKMAGNQ